MSNAKTVYERCFFRPEGEIPLEAFVVRNEFYDQLPTGQQLELCGHPIIPLREVNLNDEHIFLCLGYEHYLHFKTDAYFPKMKGRFLSADCMAFFDRAGKSLDYDYYAKHKSEFEDIYNKLQDEKSQRILEAYINQKISGKLEYLKELWDENEYFNEITDIFRVNTYVDCGAYDGDSYELFLNAYKKQMGKDYPGWAYLWEPDLENLERLRAKHGEKENIIIVEKGAWKELKTLYFSGKGMDGSITDGENSGTKIEVDSIDNVVDRPIDFIKMDIEGAEYEALLGAEKAIKKNHPILAICVYHRRDDLLRIPDLIQNFDSSYKFYLRAHLPHATDIVLYAV